jgi:uncharacterized protein (TIGR03437 family)
MLRFVLLLAGATMAFGQQYTIATAAGGSPPATPWPALYTSVGQPRRITQDSAGNLYFSSSLNCVFKMAADGTLTLVAGNSRAGFSGDGGLAVNAQLNSPWGLAFDKAGNLYIADAGNNRVRVVSPQGIINTFAGNGNVSAGGGPGAYNDEGAATDALLHLPMGVAADKNGNVYIADTGDNVVRVVGPDGIIHRFAGDTYGSYGGDYGDPLLAEVHTPSDVAVDSNGAVYIADTANALVRKVAGGAIITYAGTPGTFSYAGDDGLATKAGLMTPVAIGLDSSGNLYIVDQSDSRIRMVDSKGNITTVAGNGTADFAGDGGKATAAQLNTPSGVAADTSGNMYIADSANYRIRKVSSGNISTVAGDGHLSFSGENILATNAQLNSPHGVAVDSAGNLYLSDTSNNVVRRVGTDGKISTLAGPSAQMNSPHGLAVDAASNVYVADTGNARVLKITPSGGVTTAAAADTAQLVSPTGVAVDKAGNLYIADMGNNRVRKVSAAGTVTTVAGTGVQGFAGDGQPATSAQLNGPRGVAVDSAGNVYIADTGNNAVRMVSTDGRISTIASQIVNPRGIAVDSTGGVYVTDGAIRIRKLYATGPNTMIAGAATPGYSGDGGLAVNAQLNGPSGLAVDSSGRVYIADSNNDAIRVLLPAGGMQLAAATNGASNQIGAVAPGEVIVLYGSGLGPGNLVQAQLGSNGLLPTTLAGTTVLVNGTAAPILYTSANQVSAIVPFELTGLTAQIFVLYQGQTVAPVIADVTATAPGIFTMNGSGTGQAIAVNVADGSLNGPSHPAKPGDYVTIYATGAGQTNPASRTGAPAIEPLPAPRASVSGNIGGKDATVQYAGAALGLVNGVIQVNLQVPAGVPSGEVPVQVQVGGPISQSGVTIWIQ